MERLRWMSRKNTQRPIDVVKTSVWDVVKTSHLTHDGPTNFRRTEDVLETLCVCWVTVRSIMVTTMIVMIIENTCIITVIFWLISYLYSHLNFIIFISRKHRYHSDVRMISMLAGYNLLYLRIDNNVWYQKMFQPYLRCYRCQSNVDLSCHYFWSFNFHFAQGHWRICELLSAERFLLCNPLKIFLCDTGKECSAGDLNPS